MQFVKMASRGKRKLSSPSLNRPTARCSVETLSALFFSLPFATWQQCRQSLSAHTQERAYFNCTFRLFHFCMSTRTSNIYTIKTKISKSVRVFSVCFTVHIGDICIASQTPSIHVRNALKITNSSQLHTNQRFAK